MENQYITLMNEKEIRKIKLNDLLYVEVDGYLCTYYIENGSTFSCCTSLSKTEKMLPPDFIRINRNCLINSHKILTVNKRKRTVMLPGSIECKASVRKMRELISTLKSQNGTLMQ